MLLIGLSAGCLHARSQDISIAQEVERFQEIFLKRFYSVPLVKFNQGAFSLPQSAAKSATFHYLERLPPYLHTLIPAQAEWNRTYNGVTLNGCMSQYPPANAFPHAANGQVITIEQAIVGCLELQGRLTKVMDSMALSAFVGAFKHQSRGEPNQINMDDETLQRLYVKGYKMFWTRRGQYNYSCASCHVDNAGNTIGDELISPALGHTVIFPVYSETQALDTGNGWIALHEQYQRCMLRSRARPFPLGDPNLLALEIYQSMNDFSIPLNAPQSRP